jgi:ribosomal protein S18 acetylase RimI-like enzyme
MAQDIGHRETPPSSSTDTNSGSRQDGEGLLPAREPLVLGLHEPPIILRPEKEQDRAFLAALFRTTAARDFALLAIDDAAKEKLVQLQFASQRASYRAGFPAARFDIIEQGGEPIGRIVLDPGTTAGRIVDIALIPERRAGGLGAAILAAVMERMAPRGLPVQCQVLEGNQPSLRMFRRNGFREVDHVPPFVHLEWRPSEGSSD